MTVFFDKARKQYCYDFQIDGRRYHGRCIGTNGEKVVAKRDALAIEASARARARMEEKLPRADDLTLIQVITALSEGWQHQANWPDKRRMVAEIVQFFGADTPMHAIDGARIQDYINASLAKKRRIWIGGPCYRPTVGNRTPWKEVADGKCRSPARVNRSLGIVRAALRRAYETRDPFTGRRAIEDIPPVVDLPELKHRADPAPEAVIGRLLSILPPQDAEAVRATLFFGFRRGECFGLTTSQVDFEVGGVRLYADQVKDAEDAFLPGGPEAMDFLRQLVDRADERGTHYLFARRDRRSGEWVPQRSPKKAWATAMRKIRKEFGRTWRWHDLRAAYVTYVALAAGGLAAQKLARHSSFSTTQRYIDVADSITRAAAESASARPILAVVNGGKGGENPLPKSPTKRLRGQGHIK